MRLPRLPFPDSPVSIWAVEDHSIQVTWGGLPSGSVHFEVRDDATGLVVASPTLHHAGGPGSLVIGQLPADASLSVSVAADGRRKQLSARTLKPPPGAALGKIATISDLHLGSDHFGFFKQMRESENVSEPFAYRSAHAAIQEAVAWGATHLVIKGDAAHHGSEKDFAEVGRLVDAFPDLKMSLLPGNHDVDMVGDVPLPETVGARRLPYERHVSHVDLPGLRVVLGNTTVERKGTGSLRVIGSDLLELVRTATGPSMVVVHQQLQEHNTTRYRPPGIRGNEAKPFLDRLAAASQQVLFTSGHTHRNRLRTHGPVIISEVASTHHWPGVWAGYTIHDGGIRQVVRRIATPDVVSWHEYTKNAVMSVWGRYATGNLDERCFSHTWT